MEKRSAWKIGAWGICFAILAVATSPRALSGGEDRIYANGASSPVGACGKLHLLDHFESATKLTYLVPLPVPGTDQGIVIDPIRKNFGHFIYAGQSDSGSFTYTATGVTNLVCDIVKELLAWIENETGLNPTAPEFWQALVERLLAGETPWQDV